jgi:hypothetical protein
MIAATKAVFGQGSYVSTQRMVTNQFLLPGQGSTLGPQLFVIRIPKYVNVNLTIMASKN